MSLLANLTGTTPVKQFAKSLATDLAKRYPPHLESQPGKRPSLNRLTRIMEDVCTKAVDFQKNQNLGWLKKSVLGNSFRWELKEMGYQDDFVDFATEAVIVHLSKATSSPKSGNPSA